jgi:hypothetical protein
LLVKELRGRLREWTPLHPILQRMVQSNKFSLKTPGGSERDCQGKAHTFLEVKYLKNSKRTVIK